MEPSIVGPRRTALEFPYRAVDQPGMHCNCWSRLACFCLAGVLPVSLAACGAGSVSGSEPVPVPRVPRPVTPVVAAEPAPDPLTAYYELPEGCVRLTGVVFSAGQDMRPGRPFGSGVIIAMTRERYQQFRLDARGPWKSALLNGRDFPMPVRVLAESGVHRSNLTAGGTYALTIPPGDYVLCLANLSEVAKAASPLDENPWVDRVFDAVVTDEQFQTIIPILDRATGELHVDH